MSSAPAFCKLPRGSPTTKLMWSVGSRVCRGERGLAGQGGIVDPHEIIEAVVQAPPISQDPGSPCLHAKPQVPWELLAGVRGLWELRTGTSCAPLGASRI